MSNKNLLNAFKNKNDEFYTRYEDIESELSHYPVKYFKDKVIYCPCDVGVEWLDVPRSNFIKYFENNKKRLGYKKLLHTSLQEGYDFRSEECKQYFEEADIVVTNPPFSLFRDFVTNLEKHTIQWLIIGNMNAITYKEIFPLLKENKMWLGITHFNTGLYFYVPEGYQYSATYKFDTIKDGKQVSRVAGCCWFTNMEHNRRNEPLILTKKYDPTVYPKYDNYDAIDCGSVKDIPYDYDGCIGVPITFFDKYNPDQFEIIGKIDPILNNKNLYKRILIRRKR